MAIKRFIICAILFAATVFAQGAAKPSEGISENSGIADTAAIMSGNNGVTDTAVNVSDNGTVMDSTVVDSTVTVSENSNAVKQKKTDVKPNRPAPENPANPANTANTKPDSVVMPGKYYGFGAGLSLGAIPLFTMWKNETPDSLSLNRLGIPTDFGKDIDTGDIGGLKYRVIEAPEEFNFFIPFQLSLHSVKDNRTASVGLSFFYNAKQFQAEIDTSSPGTEGHLVSIYETMKFYSLTLEASWQVAIPPEYFSLKGSQKTFVSAALGVSPVQYITRYSDVNATGENARMKAVADTAKKSMWPDFWANGASVSWRIGISSLKSLTNGSALEMGFYYSGAYSGYFSNNDTNEVMESAIRKIKTGEGEKDNPLSFFSNRIEFKVTYLVPVKREKNKRNEIPQEQPVRKDDDKVQDDDNKVQGEQPENNGQPEQQAEQEQPDNTNDSSDGQEQQEGGQIEQGEP